MTLEQREALDRTKASYAYGREVGATAGSFNIADMGTVLELVENMEILLQSAKDDLYQLLELDSPNKELLAKLVRSSLDFLEDK